MLNNFRYKASRDITAILIGSFFALVIFVIIAVMISEKFVILKIFYAVIAILVIIANILSIYINTFNYLTIGIDEITYNTGWLTKKTTLIPANKIRSCSKSSGILQRACNTMDIYITTSGDSAEIYFCNIGNGEEAYRLISMLAKNNENAN